MVNNKILISKVERVPSPLGDPDVKLTEPFLISPSDLTLSSWFIDLTEENWFMISSDKILTTFEPSQSLLEKYQSLIK